MSGKKGSGISDGDSATPCAATRDAAKVTCTEHAAHCAAGAFACLICLLDAQGRIVQVNPTVERWELGSTTAVLGRDLHGLLHPHCTALPCALAAIIAEYWAFLQREASCEADLRETASDRVLHLSAWRVPPLAFSEIATGDPLTVVVVVDITAPQPREGSVSAMEGEIELQVRIRTEALAHSNEDLQSELVCCQAALEQLRGSRHEFAAVSRQFLTAQELERQRIAQQLRESVSQSLSAVKYILEQGVELARQSRLRAPLALLQRAITGLQEAIRKTGAIAMNVRPSVLDDFGAASAVTEFCRQFSRSHPMLQVRTEMSVQDCAVPKRLNTAVFRSVQELLNNVATRAHARHIVVSLSQISEHLVLEVLDDGLTSTVAQKSSGTTPELLALRVHAEISGGQFSLLPEEGGLGTRTRIQWSLTPAEIIGATPA